MGQYYHPVFLEEDKKTVKKYFHAHRYGEGLKIMEHSFIKNKFVGAVESCLLNNPTHIVWAGDYAEKCTEMDSNVYNRCTKDLEVNPKNIPQQVVAERYVVNHTKKEFIDKTKGIIGADGYIIHPLPLMTCEGNGQGGGDFFGEDPKGLVGSWTRDLISIEGQKPEGFTEIIFDLVE
jgi:hypothetical protein